MFQYLIRKTSHFLSVGTLIPDSVLRVISPLSSDSGRGADYSGPAVTSSRPSAEVTLPAFEVSSSFKSYTSWQMETDPKVTREGTVLTKIQASV